MADRLSRSKSLARMLWFVGIYLASLAAFAAVVYGLRALVPG